MSIRFGWITAAVLAAALTGCGGGGHKDEGKPPTTEATPAPETTGTAGNEPVAPTDAAATAGTVEIKATWTGEGDAKKAAVKLGDAELAQLDPKTPFDPKTMEPNPAVVDALKAKRDEAMKGGATAPKCVIMCTTDMDFNAIGKHLMKAAFKAGFKPGAEVEYKAGS